MTNLSSPLVLIVEDEIEMATLIAGYLKESGMKTQVCHRARQAHEFLQDNFANLLLLDITLPDQTGFELLSDLRAQNINVPVIFVTGNSIEECKIKGLDLGGDDYITKPFSFPELVARIRAVLRRAEAAGVHALTSNVSLIDQPFDFCGAQVNPQRLELVKAGEAPVKIGRKEIGIMAYLVAHRGDVIPRNALIHAVWGQHANVKSRSLDQYVVKVRAFCRGANAGEDALRTVHGVGYIFDPEAAPQSETVA